MPSSFILPWAINCRYRALSSVSDGFAGELGEAVYKLGMLIFGHREHTDNPNRSYFVYPRVYIFLKLEQTSL